MMQGQASQLASLAAGMGVTYIYGLADPMTGHLRYIGKTVNLGRRLHDHLRATDRSHRTDWVHSLLTRGLQPEIFAIEEVSEANWQEAEQFWIGYFRSIGADLTNGSEGGLGGSLPGHQMAPAANARRIAAVKVACTGRRPSEATLEAARGYHLGRPVPPETKAKMSASHKGVPKSPEHVAKVAAFHRGRKRSAEACARMSAAKKGQSHPQTAETRIRIAAAKLGAGNPMWGRVYSDEAREVQRQRMTAWWRDRKAGATESAQQQ